jgi:succinate dehydrogenase / fumarate reductase membrane anchor subunit
MVTQVTSLSRNGVSDWIIQRATAVILAAYTVCQLGFVLVNPELDYATWSAFHSGTAMQIFTMLALVSICAHAWIGMWAVGSDYLQEHLMGPKATPLRFMYQIGCVLIVIVYLLWGIDILWGN